jgi:hypothetical protein
MPSPSENPALLTLLDNRPALWAMIATWPNVPRDADDAEGGIVPFRLWADMALLPEFEVRANWKLLVYNGFVKRDGTVDPVAMNYVRGLVVDDLPAAIRAQLGKK